MTRNFGSGPDELQYIDPRVECYMEQDANAAPASTVLELVSELARFVTSRSPRAKDGRNAAMFVQRYAYGWSLDQVAETAGISTGRASQILATMRERVRLQPLNRALFVRLMHEAASMTRATHTQATSRLRSLLGPGVPLSAALDTGAELWGVEPTSANWKAMRWYDGSRSNPRLRVRRYEGRSPARRTHCLDIGCD